MPSELSASLQFLQGVGPRLASIFAKRGVTTVEDALYYLPRAFEDRRQATLLKNARPGESVVVRGRVVRSRWLGFRGRRQFEAELVDVSGGRVVLHWFHGFASLPGEFTLGRELSVYGELRFFRGRLQMAHPDFDTKGTGLFRSVLPVYPLPEGLSQNVVRKVVRSAVVASLAGMEEVLPERVRDELTLMSLKDALQVLHLPEDVPDPATLKRARSRIIFEEFFVFELGLLLSRSNPVLAPVMRDASLMSLFEKALPFAFTIDQQRVIKEIATDLSKDRPMSRLLQGDVGSGKTVVALSAACLAAGSGHQTALMAPTESLASQHFLTVSKLLDPLGVFSVLLVSGSDREIRGRVRSGEAKLIVGTHALFQQGVEFRELGLVIVDEQHRFGVRQRLELLKKAGALTPHLLMMTATPIPRTLSLTLYGDLDVSIIRSKPQARRPIKTRVLFESARGVLRDLILQRISRGEQVYVIYPLVEQSEKLDLRSATEMVENWKTALPGFSVELIHGRMQAGEKNQILNRFRENRVQVLIATTVVEVGIDVPNATLMIVEHSERLGLSQLHQLRGRVGRGSKESECIFVASSRTKRLCVLERSDDGFEIAEEDLKIRGPGEFLGTQQSGLPGFRVGDVVSDVKILECAREQAQSLLQRDPQLMLSEHARLRHAVNTIWRQKMDHVWGG